MLIHVIRGVAVVGSKRNECAWMNVTGQGLEEVVFSYWYLLCLSYSKGVSVEGVSSGCFFFFCFFL